MIHRRLYAVLVISASLHAAMLLSWFDRTHRVEVYEASGGPLQLAIRSNTQSMMDAEPSPPVRAPEPPTAKPPGGRETHADRRQPRDEPAGQRGRAQDGLRRESRQEDRASGTGSARADNGAVVADATAALAADRLPHSVSPALASESPSTGRLSAGQVRERLHEAVETYFYYPRLARNRGWEGEVVVDVRLDQDGRLRSVDVVSSSGYRVLDDAAVDSIRRLARLEIEGANTLPVSGVEVRMPVQYRLIDAPA